MSETKSTNVPKPFDMFAHELEEEVGNYLTPVSSNYEQGMASLKSMPTPRAPTPHAPGSDG